jgi:hypothetical protein
MAAENRLTFEQLAALVPGDTVCIETTGDFRRPHLRPGTVVRLEGSCIVISTRSARGVPYVDRYGRRDGIRVGGGRHAELVNGDPAAQTPRRRPEVARIDAAYRAWARDRDDLDKLRELHAAIAEVLGSGLVSSR